jgi:hypothetical protein
MGGRWIEAEPRLKKRESLFGVQRGMFRGAVGLVNLVLRCNVRNNESAAVALRIRIANLKSGQHPGAKPITKKRALPSTFLLLGRAWGTFWGAATPAQEGEVMQTALTMVLGKHHLKVSRRCSDKAEFHILQHLHFYNSPNSKYLFEDNMEKINQEQVPAKVIKYVTLVEIPKYPCLTTTQEEELDRMLIRSTQDLCLHHLFTTAPIGQIGLCSYKTTHYSLNLAGRSTQKQVGNCSPNGLN